MPGSRPWRVATSSSGYGAAEKLGKADVDADAYAEDVVRADFEEAEDEDVLRKVRADFDAAGVAVTDLAIRSEMDRLLEKAAEQVRNA